MKKSTIIMMVSIVLAIALGIGGTLAYLTSTDEDVNVMTLGNVEIEQHEYQRVKNEDGTYKTDTIDGVTSYVLEDFDQGKPLYPIYGDPSLSANDPGYKGFDDTVVRMTQVGSYGFMQVFEGVGAQDKFVTVENTGSSPAYVRTLIAYEYGTLDHNIVNIGARSVSAEEAEGSTMPWIENEIGIITVEGNNYYLVEYIYRGASDVPRHENGILPAGDTTYPNLSQVYMVSSATNEDVMAIDGNKNGTYDILVLSQAVQTTNMETIGAEKALDVAFGDITVENHPWVDKVVEWPDINEFVWPTTSWSDNAATLPAEVDGVYTISTAAEMAAFANAVNIDKNTFSGKTVKLAADIDLGKHLWTPVGQTGATEFKGVFDGQNYTIKNLYVNSDAQTGKYYSSGLFGWVEDHGSKITIKNVTVDGANILGHHNVAVIAGYLEGGSTVENCHVKNAILNCTNANEDADGDKCGAIAGYVGNVNVTIKGCSVENSTISSGRDAGQLLGASYTTPVDCSATNVTVTANGTGTGKNINEELIGRKL